MTTWIVFFGALIVIGGLIVLAWRLWWSFTETSPQDLDVQRDIAKLNERQSTRTSEESLLRPPDTDKAWQMMVAQGKRKSRNDEDAQAE